VLPGTGTGTVEKRYKFFNSYTVPVQTFNQGCGSGSGFRDFADPDPGARKLRNFSGKMHLSYGIF
jgi:hypothetical protein